MTLYDPRHCTLGEGALWHPTRKQFFWFDILGNRLLTLGAEWQFNTHVSAAGWLDEDHLLIATQTALVVFDLRAGKITDHVTDLEADNPLTRSNDGRADPWGGFWIGTMGLAHERGAGAIYRYYQGALTKVYPGITIPNAICFAPDRSMLYFTDTPKRQIMRQALDNDGWPVGEPDVHINLRHDQLNPDGAVTDAAGNLWNAQWGASRVACYGPDGTEIDAIHFPASQISCPAFGGDDLRTLYATSARDSLTNPMEADGQTFAITVKVQGIPEPRVIL